MAYLGNPTNTAAILNTYGFRFQKKYGQNFLIDNNILENIVKAAGVTKDDMVLEIGPGIGTLTQYLAEAAGSVVAVEIDDNLIPILEHTLAEYNNVTTIHNDVLKVDIKGLAEEKNNGKPIKVVANLPYYITTPIIMELLENHVPFESLTVMVQSEVADRMQSGPGTKDYGALSLAVQYYTDPQVMLEVSPNCFMPRPNVGSSVIKLTKHSDTKYTVNNEELLFKLIRAAFNQRRKTLSNAISNAGNLNFSRQQVVDALVEMNLSETVRGEALTLEQFVELANKIEK